MNPRGQCPACGQAQLRLAADLPYGAPPLADYLREFYRPYPDCDFRPLAEARYRLMECAVCGCMFQDPVPDDAFLAEFYGRGLYGTDRREKAPVDPYQIRQAVGELMMVVHFLHATNRGTCVLDFGTGNGDWALLAAGTGLEVHATDLSDHAFGRLAARGITCHRTDALPGPGFDFINTEQVFEHLVDPTRRLQVLVHCLRPGGVIKIGVPHDPGLRRKLRRPDWTAPKNSPDSLNGVAPIEHLNHFEPASLRAMADRAGLRQLAVSGWSLVEPGGAADPLTLWQHLGRWVRRRTGDYYHPFHPHTQTVFFLKPA